MSFNKTSFPPDHELGLGDAAEYKADQPNYPNGCHICEVEIDPETGKIWVVKYTVIDDVGTCLLYTSPSPRDVEESRMPSSA